MTTENKTNTSIQNSSQGFLEQNQLMNRFDDEIDLRELFLKLWAGKLYIIGSVCVFVLVGFLYTLYTKPTYQASAIISPPQKTGLEVLDVFQTNNRETQSELIDSALYTREKIYSRFKQNLNSVLFLRTFILSQPVFTQDLAQLENEIHKENLVQDWIGDFKVENIKPKLSKFQTSLDEMKVSFQDALPQDELQKLFMEYLKQVIEKTRGDLYKEVSSSLGLKTTNLKERTQYIETESNQEFEQQIRILQENLKIAESYGLNDPTISPGTHQAWQIDQSYYLMGAKLIQAEIQRLESLRTMGVRSFDANLQTDYRSLKAQLGEVEAMQKQISEQAIQPISEYSLRPVEKVAPKTLLILAIAFVLGGMIGVFLVFIKDFVMARKN